MAKWRSSDAAGLTSGIECGWQNGQRIGQRDAVMQIPTERAMK
jgi:hypothetical protein